LDEKRLKFPVEFIGRAVVAYEKFIHSCRKSFNEFCLTPHAEISSFALCFAIFGLHLIGKLDEYLQDKNEIGQKLLQNLKLYKKQREKEHNLKYDKPFLQLLTFTLSCLFILGKLKDEPLEQFVLPCLSKDVFKDLKKIGALDGRPQSGNKAMFIAILLIHARDFLSQDTQTRIDDWVEVHLSNMNRFGFWQNDSSMTYSHFQNGYHQYEIFEFLKVENPKKNTAALSVLSLIDEDGHFSPYPGGGGCYDYDAVSLITGSEIIFHEHADLLIITANSIFKEQNEDGGFSESLKIRPRSVSNLYSFVKHISFSKAGRLEKIKWCLNLLRPKHDFIHTHWSRYSRKWEESDLWDSWFRLLTIARIQTALHPGTLSEWGFIRYPGIGYHPDLV